MLGIDKFMWGSDYPHAEGTYPFTREHLRQVFPGWEPVDLSRVLAENAAAFYDFDIDTAVEDLPEKVRKILLFGSGKQEIPFSYINERGRASVREHVFEGIIPNLERRYRETDSAAVRVKHVSFTGPRITQMLESGAPVFAS